MKALYSISVLAAGLLTFSVPANASKRDAGIEAAARESYVFQTYLKGEDIRVESVNGAVTLTGVVSEPSRRSLAQDTVAGLHYVKSVENKLEVRSATTTANSDAWLSDKLKISLMFHRNVSVGKAEVEVKDGVVTLRGAADSLAQKELTTEYAKDIEGVKEVKNEMTVLEVPELAARTTGEKIDDASITAQVKMALLLHRSTSFLNTAVSTRKGVVKLDGKARNAAEKDLVTKIVTDINGVKSVKNRMDVE